jgi:hypothetical protein
VKELRVRVKGFTEKDVRRLRKPRKGAAISSGVVLSGLVFTALLTMMDVFHADTIIDAFRIDQGGGILTGDCSGTIRASPLRGYVGETQDVTVTINPPFHRVVTRVTTDNPRCRDCVAKPQRPGKFLYSGNFGGKGPFRITFLASVTKVESYAAVKPKNWKLWERSREKAKRRET